MLKPTLMMKIFPWNRIDRRFLVNRKRRPWRRTNLFLWKLTWTRTLRLMKCVLLIDLRPALSNSMALNLGNCLYKLIGNRGHSMFLEKIPSTSVIFVFAGRSHKLTMLSSSDPIHESKTLSTKHVRMLEPPKTALIKLQRTSIALVEAVQATIKSKIDNFFLELKFCVVAFTASTNAIDVRCNFMRAMFGGSNILTCFVEAVRESIGCANPDEITIVNPGDLPSGNVISDVEGIFSRNIEWPRFPINLYKQFPRLRAIEFDNAGLRSIRSTHFINLNVLVHVSFQRNRFVRLQGRLFRFTRNLRSIRFHGNIFIINVGFNIFGNLPYLRDVNFDGIGCGRDKILSGTGDFSRIASRLMRACPPDEDDLTDDLDGMQCDFDTSKESKSSSSRG
ncbi:unnamed protein product [Chironomus riparius]|uniref:Uncharacterized protein n=1 Tax=Chironomus riparius TaxID=315576 RepID=A0A9N9WVI9_9DIPT|nr:unnamed protein product [Chironomus riparius]